MQKSAHLEALLDWLYYRVNYERQSKPSTDSFHLDTMRCLIERLGNPHLNFPVIHVAGTKGKGSVTSMIGQILSESGRKTGVYVSPHLEAINQRILVNTTPISNDDLCGVLSQLQPIVDHIDNEAQSSEWLRPVTFFEIITAAALVYFSQQRVDAAVLEVGLGGRLDSTNICHPEVSVITSISFDHMQQLGDTLAKIAFEKAGIIKPGIPVVSGVEPASVEPAEVIQTVAETRHSKLIQLARDFSVESPDSSDGFTYIEAQDQGPIRIENIDLSLFGCHQRNNAALAIAACRELNRRGWNISESDIRAGLKRTWLPGRTEIIASQPLVVLDIAHNPASIAALVDSLHRLEQFYKGKRILILAISRDKDAKTMLKLILPHFDIVIFTAFICNPRSLDPQELLSWANEIDQSQPFKAASVSFRISPTSLEALELAKALSNEDDLICIAGSVFLVGDLRPLLVPQSER